MNGALLGGLLGGAALLAGLSLTYVHVPMRRPPVLNASVVQAGLTLGGHVRTYVAVIPDHLLPGAPLLLVFHGSMQTGQAIRESMGYAFDRLAVQHGFVVVYPDAYKGAWHDCRTAADFPARRENIDDVGLARALIAQFHDSHRIDLAQVYAAGYSNGGQMVFRLAAEAAGEFAGLAAIAATQPTDDNFACAAPTQGVPMLLIGGTRDPIVPYGGGMISLFGMQPRGTARSFTDTARFYAERNGITATPATSALSPSVGSGPTSVTVSRAVQGGKLPVTAYTVLGGGHVVPGPDSAFPRLMGRIDRHLDAPTVIWDFFTGVTAGSTSDTTEGFRKSPS